MPFPWRSNGGSAVVRRSSSFGSGETPLSGTFKRSILNKWPKVEGFGTLEGFCALRFASIGVLTALTVTLWSLRSSPYVFAAVWS